MRTKRLIWAHPFAEDCFIQWIHSNTQATVRFVETRKDKFCNTTSLSIVLKQNP